ncbi:hypothetical protein QQ045_025813 [Rhodiola kirilowii]
MALSRNGRLTLLTKLPIRCVFRWFLSCQNIWACQFIPNERRLQPSSLLLTNSGVGSKLGRTTIRKIQSLIHNFWWNHGRSRKGVYCIRQEVLKQSKDDGGLAFRDWRCLNLAFLAKQAWRIQSHPHLLVSKIFQTKYFHNTHLLDSRLGYKPSTVCAAIHTSLPIIRAASVWNRSNGELSWNVNNCSAFSLKSAYVVARQLASSVLARVTGAIRQIPGTANNAGAILVLGRDLVVVPKLIHPIPPALSSAEASSPENHIEDTWMQELNANRPATPTRGRPQTTNENGALAWMNLALRGKSPFHPRLAYHRIHALLTDYTSNRPGHLLDINMHGLAWHRPPMNVTKINYDGSLCNVTGSGGVGVFSRDHRGVVLAIRGLHVRSCNDVLDIEGMALKEAFMLAADLRLNNVIFETDCQNLVASINYKTDDMVWHKDWFTFCSRLLQKERGWNLVLIRREANGAADSIARCSRFREWQWTRLDGR